MAAVAILAALPFSCLHAPVPLSAAETCSMPISKTIAIITILPTCRFVMFFLMAHTLKNHSR